MIRKNEEHVLTSLGLSPSQARVYLTLVHNGSSKINGISQASGIHRTHLYEVLKSLENRGLAEKELESGEYTAIPLKEATQSLVKQQREEISKLESEANAIAESLSKKSVILNKKNEFLLTSNKNHSLSKGSQYISSAQIQIDQMHTWKRFAQLWARFESTFEEAMRRRVLIRQIVEFPPDLNQGQSFLNRDIFKNSMFELRFVPKTGGNLTIIDNIKVFFSTSQDKENLGETPLIFSDYEGLLGLMRTYYAYSWKFSFSLRNGELINQYDQRPADWLSK